MWLAGIGLSCILAIIYCVGYEQLISPTIMINISWPVLGMESFIVSFVRYCLYGGHIRREYSYLVLSKQMEN